MRPALLALLVLLASCDPPSRIALDPQSVHLYARGQSARVRASPFARNGRPLPTEVCAWSSTDEKVAMVKASHNEVEVTAVGPGSAALRCRLGALVAEAPVSIRIVGRIEASPERAELKMLDRPEPVGLQIRAYDTEGLPFSGRAAVTRCDDEDVCRGDDRGQLWAVGPGESRVTVEVDQARTTVTAHVVDARTAEGRPKRVKGNPMLDYEKALNLK
jgi:hypothetical protein